MKKLLSVIMIPIIVILTFVFQIFVANNFEIFGVTPNLILVTVVIVSMWNTLVVNLTVAGIMGIFTDLIFKFELGESIISYLVIALCVSYISGKYRKESKAAIVYITAMATSIFTGFQFIYYIIDTVTIVNIFVLIKQIIVEILLNIAIAYIVYKVFEKSMKEDILNSVYR